MEEILAQVKSWMILACLFVFVFSAGCQTKRVPPLSTKHAESLDFTQPLPEGQLALRKVSPGEYPDFSKALARINPADLHRAIENSLAYLSRPSSRKKYPYLDIDHDRAVASLKAFEEVVDSPSLTASPQQFNQTIAERFEVYQSIGAARPSGAGYTGKVLFTGYFTPTYDASLTRGGAFLWPIYKRPADLISDETGD